MIKKYELAKTDIGEILSILERSTDSFPKEEAVVSDIIEDIRKNGDSALFSYMKKFDKVDLAANNCYVSEDEIKKAYEVIDPDLLKTIKIAASNIRRYHEKQLRNTWLDFSGEDVILGQKITPLEKVGVYVPGGKASYPSTVLMDSIPARIAGVDEVYMVTPPNSKGEIAPEIIVAGNEAGVDRIFKIGGAQAIAALTFGTDSVPRVNKIVGPGNIYVALAKKQVFGHVGLDSIAGPSEITVLADESANPVFVAADMLSQAEHDEMASSILVTDSKDLADQVMDELEKQLDALTRKDIARSSIDDFGLILIASDIKEAVDTVNDIAPEHLEVMTKNPFSLLGSIRNAGAIFLGEYSCEPLGDYFAGPNHVLPTNGTAKFFSPLGVDDFIKKSSIISYGRDSFIRDSDHVMRFAHSEGLMAHANSIKVRKDSL